MKRGVRLHPIKFLNARVADARPGVTNIGERSLNVLIISVVMLSAACGVIRNPERRSDEEYSRTGIISTLRDSLELVANSYPGEIGVAVITSEGDTIAVNNEAKYPMMSVFKLHQAIALCGLSGEREEWLDSVVRIVRGEMNPDTWSPMLKDYKGGIIEIPIRRLMEYTLSLSDNNASNWMFDHLQDAERTDAFIGRLIPRVSFRIRYTEREMGENHALAYKNRTSPLGAAILINRLYTDSIIGSRYSDFIRSTLDRCKTGGDRLVAPLEGFPGVVVGHKTGSGYRDKNGVLAAHNDVGFVRLPDGSHYAVAVFVKDFHGDEEGASAAIARISALVFRGLSDK